MRPGGYPVAIQNEPINYDKSKLLLENIIQSYKNYLMYVNIYYYYYDYNLYVHFFFLFM